MRTTETSGKIPRAVACGERTIEPGDPSPRENSQAAPLSPQTKYTKKFEEAGLSKLASPGRGEGGGGGQGPGAICLRAEGHSEVTDL